MAERRKEGRKSKTKGGDPVFLLRNRKEYLRNYNTTADGIFSHLKHGAKRRKISLDFNKEDFIAWYQKQKQQCHYCKRSLGDLPNDKRKQMYRFSIDRKKNDIGYSLENIVLSCSRCNSIKSYYFTEEEMLKIGNFIEHDLPKPIEGR